MESSGKVLIAENSATDRKKMAQILSEQGMQVIELESGDKVLETALQQTPNIFILSISLPGMNFWDLCWNLRHDLKLKNIPIVLISESTDIHQRLKGFKLGINDFLSKPFNTEEFLARIIYLLEKEQAENLRKSQRVALEGNLSVVPIGELLHELFLARKTGKLQLQTKNKIGVISFKEGEISGAEEGDVRGEKALYRFFYRNEGEFKFVDEVLGEDCSIHQNINSIIYEGNDRLRKFKRILKELLNPEIRLILTFSPEFFNWGMKESTPLQRHLLYLIHVYQNLDLILDKAPGDDLIVLQECEELLINGFLKVIAIGKEPDPQFEQIPLSEMKKEEEEEILSSLKYEEQKKEGTKELEKERLEDVKLKPLEDNNLAQLVKDGLNVQFSDISPADEFNKTFEELPKQEVNQPLTDKDKIQEVNQPLTDKDKIQEIKQEQAQTPGDFSGKWNIRVKQEGIPVNVFIIILKLEQKGDDITGTFLRKVLIGRSSTYKGRIDGKIHGKKLTVKWSDDARMGEGEFILSEDARNIEGKWSATGPNAAGTWSGEKK